MQVYKAIQKEQLIEAVDQYDLFPPKYKLILNTLRSIATVTVKGLSRLCNRGFARNLGRGKKVSKNRYVIVFGKWVIESSSNFRIKKQ